MGLRIFGGAAAALLAAYAVLRYRKGQLRRGELLVVLVVVTALSAAAVAPSWLDPFLSALGFEPGEERRIIGLLVVSNLFTLGLLFRGFSRDDELSGEVGDLVDYIALRRFEEHHLAPARGVCAVVIPAYNEADNLPAVLEEMPTSVGGVPVVPIVVADGCTDSTEATAQGFDALVIRRDLRRGSGAAVRLGYQAALRSGADVIVTMDADGQHDPKEMDQLVEPLLSERADMVQGSRVLGSFDGARDSRARRQGIKVFSKLLSALGRTEITDPSNGYRAVTSDALRRLELRENQFYVSEIILEASRKGLRVIEVPITVRKRSSGATKKPSTLRYAWGFTKAIAMTWLRQPPGERLLETEPRWISNAGARRTPVADDARDSIDLRK